MIFLFGANDVDIYNSLALLTIDTNINQFTLLYHFFNKMQYKTQKLYLAKITLTDIHFCISVSVI